MTVATASERRARQADAKNPWLGLRSYDEGDRDFFCGRDREVQDLLRSVSQSTLTVLFGTSGLGKTSLINAGLLPRLRDHGFFPVRVVFQYADDAQPEDDDAELVDQIRSQIALSLKEHSVTEDPLAESLERSETLWEYLHRVRFWHLAEVVTPVLVFDQFEDIFRHGRQSATANRWTNEVIQQLADVIENHVPSIVRRRVAESGEALPFTYEFPPANVLLSLREEYLADLEDLNAKIPSLRRSERLHLLEMRGTQAKSAIIKPGSIAKIIDEDVAVKIVKRIGVERKHYFRARPSEEPEDELERLEIEPFLLSMVCRNLNDQRLRNKADRITEDLLSGVQRDILGPFYEDSIRDVSPSVRRFIEDELVGGSGFREMVAMEKAVRPGVITRRELDTLVDRRLLRYQEDRHGVMRVELSHDRLLPIVRASRERRMRREGWRKFWRRAGLGFFTSLVLLAGIRLLWLQKTVHPVEILLGADASPVKPSLDGSVELFLWPPEERAGKASRELILRFPPAVTGFSGWSAATGESTATITIVEPDSKSSENAVQCTLPSLVKSLEVTARRHDWLWSYKAQAKVELRSPDYVSGLGGVATVAIRPEGSQDLSVETDRGAQRIPASSSSRLILSPVQKPWPWSAVYVIDGEHVKPLVVNGDSLESEDFSLTPDIDTTITVYVRKQPDKFYRAELTVYPDSKQPQLQIAWSPQATNNCYDVSSTVPLTIIVEADEVLNGVTVLGLEVNKWQPDTTGRRFTGTLAIPREGSHEPIVRAEDMVHHTTEIPLNIDITNSGPRVIADESAEKRKGTWLAVGNGRLDIHIDDNNGIESHQCRTVPPLALGIAKLDSSTRRDLRITLPDERTLWTGTLEIEAWDKCGQGGKASFPLEIRPHDSWQEQVEWNGIQWIRFRHENRWLYMSQTEISNAQYEANRKGFDGGNVAAPQFAGWNAKHCNVPLPALWPEEGGFPRYSGPNDNELAAGQFPVVGLTPEEAEKFAECLSARLPTEHQWLTAARKDNPHGEYPWRVDEEPEARLRCNYYKSWEVEGFVGRRSKWIKTRSGRLSLYFAEVDEEDGQEPTAGRFLHIVGNVAELVGRHSGPGYLIMGGHFDDKYEDLKLSKAKVEYRGGRDEQMPGGYRIGLRLVIDVDGEGTNQEFRDRARVRE